MLKVKIQEYRVNNTILSEMIKREEGYRKDMYKCSMGFRTIGYGYNIDAGMSEEEAEVLLNHRLGKLTDALRVKYDWFHQLNEARQAVVVSMNYQLGEAGFSKFKKMIVALEVGDYKEAAAQSLNSRYATQTPNRAKRQAKLLIDG